MNVATQYRVNEQRKGMPTTSWCPESQIKSYIEDVMFFSKFPSWPLDELFEKKMKCPWGSKQVAEENNLWIYYCKTFDHQSWARCRSGNKSWTINAGKESAWQSELAAKRSRSLPPPKLRRKDRLHGRYCRANGRAIVDMDWQTLLKS